MAERKESSMIGDLQEELTEQGRNVWLAGLGALATVEEEGAKIFNRFVERGKGFEERRSKELNQLLERASEEQERVAENVSETAEGVAEASGAAQSMLVKAVTEAMERLGVPTQSRVDTLSRRVEELSRKVDDLTRALDKPRDKPKRGAVYHVQQHEEGWAVMKEGNERATSVHDTKDEAVEAGRTVAQEHTPSRLVVHKQDGSIQEEVTY